MSLVLRSIIQCPYCGFKVTERMSASSCVLQFICPACAGTMTGTPERCVFCCHGSVGCPSVQTTGVCCGAHANAITKA